MLFDKKAVVFKKFEHFGNKWIRDKFLLPLGRQHKTLGLNGILAKEQTCDARVGRKTCLVEGARVGHKRPENGEWGNDDRRSFLQRSNYLLPTRCLLLPDC